WVLDFGEETSTQADDVSKNNSLDIYNWVEADVDEAIPDSAQQERNKTYEATNVESGAYEATDKERNNAKKADEEEAISDFAQHQEP
ncbi:hypothetical protein Tco_0314321, partial [Tanacetum coccineum]